MGSKWYRKDSILGFECRQMHMNARTVIPRDGNASRFDKRVWLSRTSKQDRR